MVVFACSTAMLRKKKRRKNKTSLVGLVTRPKMKTKRKEKRKRCGLRVRSGPKHRGVGVRKMCEIYTSVSASVCENRKYINGVIICIYILIGIIIIIICES